MDKLNATGMIIIASMIAPIALGGAAEDIGRAVFSEVERRVIRDYYHEKYSWIDRDHRDRDRGRDRDRDEHEPHKHKKKGKGKESGGPGNPKGLPPGIVKKLERGGTLPPGIAKKNLPTDLESRLPPVRGGYERREVDGRVVLIEAATNTIVDIIRRAELLETSSREDRARTPSREPAATLEDRRDDRADTPRAAKPRQQDKAWWEFWKD